MSAPEPSGAAGAGAARLQAFVDGDVQGVGFRWWAGSTARELGLVGHAANLPDGRVEVSAQGPRDACERLLRLLEPASGGDGGGSGLDRLRRWAGRRPGRVTAVTHEWLAPDRGLQAFEER